MTQATVNVGNNAVKNLNPNAQQFSSSDFNNGTVLAGSTVPSDDSYAEYLDNGTGTYLPQHQSHMYSVDPSSIDTLQQQQQHQQQQSQTDPNFTPHEHVTMLDTIDHQQQTSLINPNHHLHHPQSHIHQTMPEEDPAQQLQITPEQLRENLKKQLEYYFSRENMINDRYLKSQMDHEDYVPIAIIANFKLVKRLTHDMQLIIDVLKELPSVEVDPEERKVRSADEKRYPTRKRCIIILRDVPLDATETEVSELFLNEHCPVPAVAYERALESGTSGCWYVTFNSEDDAQNAFLYLTRENVSIRGQKVLARMKARLWQKPSTSSSVPSTHPTTPVSPPITATNSGATSPPTIPNQQQVQQQQPMQTYQNATYIPQQQPQVPQASPAQYSTHPQQQQQQAFNQQAGQQHPSVYVPTPSNTHPNQATILGNLQAQTNNYRPHPLHSSVAPPPPQHVPTQYSTTNQTQHPTSMDHTQVMQQLRISYPNYPTNPQFDRPTWSTPHPQTVQTAQQTLSFATTAQQANMSSYPTSIHQHPQFITANHPVFPQNLWYMPSPYQTADQYSTMAYNGANKQKNRPPREYLGSKPRNSTKPPGARNSRHEGLQINNEHSNELLDYCQHSTPHSEGSSSPVPRAEAVINRTNEPIAQPVSNIPLQHVQGYSTDTTTNDNIEHYHHQSTNDVLYNNTNNNPNSHIQQLGSTDTTSSQEQSNDLGKFPNQSSYSTSTSVDNSKLNYQPLEQRKPNLNNQDQQQQHQQISTNDNQQSQSQQQQQSNRKANSQQQQQQGIRPLMQTRENRSTQNNNRPSSTQQGRPPQYQTRMNNNNNNNNNNNSSTPLTVNIPKNVSSATYYNQTSSSSSPQSPNSNQKNQQQQQQQQLNDNNGPRTYADMLKVKQAPQQQQNQQSESTKSPTNETNDLTSPRAQSPSNPKTDSVSVNTTETNGPLSSASSDLSPANQVESSNNNNTSSQSSTINDNNSNRRNSSASDHPQQQHSSSSPSHQQYSNSRGGRGGGAGRGGGGGAYRYSNNDRRSGSNNSLNRGGGGGRGGGRRSVNNNSGSNGPSGYPSRGGGGGGRGNGRFFDRSSRGGGGNYHNSNQTVHRFTNNPGNIEPQVSYPE